MPKIGRYGTQDRLIFRLNRDGLFLIFQILGRRYCVSAGRLSHLGYPELD